MNSIGPISAKLPPCRMLLGYGSGIFRQKGYERKPGLVDLLALVSEKSAFLNDLSSLKLIGRTSHFMGQIFDPEILYFADMGLTSTVRVKLGVIQFDKCMSRLSDWDDSFYIPGRFQKPIQVLHSSDSATTQTFDKFQESNHEFALTAAVLMLPEPTFSLDQLYTSLVGLSYLGDIRVGIAENPQKIPNIVFSQLELLHAIYEKHFDAVGIRKITSDQYTCSLPRDVLWENLPLKFRRKALHLVDPRQALCATLSSINQRESIEQGLVGFTTTGPTRSIQYLFAKLSKRFS